MKLNCSEQNLILDFFSACSENANQDANTDLKSVVLVILAVSLLGIGIGQTAIATLGIPYIDDNVKSKQSPLYMAITIGVRVLGPALGYYLGSICIRQYVDLSKNVDHTDPNFIGAWWLGKFQFTFMSICKLKKSDKSGSEHKNPTSRLMI